MNRVEEVSQFLEFFLTCLLKKLRQASGSENAVTALTASAVEAVTIYYVGIDSSRSQRIFELSGNIGTELRRCATENRAVGKYASDYSEMVGDCFHKELDLFSTEHCLGFFEPLNASALSFVLLAAHQTMPNRLEELIRDARTKGSFNKLIETYESSCAGQ